MNSKEADRLGLRILQLISSGERAAGDSLLAPLLAQRFSFRLLDRIGARIGEGPIPETAAFLERVARGKPMGGWPLIGSALAAQANRDLEGALERCRAFILLGDVWYAADTLAERVPGSALVTEFARTLSVLKDWRTDSNRWVRKSCGVAVHYWAKRSRGETRHLPQLRDLMKFLGPMFTEQEIDAAKGIGWALKTLGRYYPEALTPWLIGRIERGCEYRGVVLRKAVTYLPKTAKAKVLKAARR
jgi:hypothetical protein